MSKGKIERKRVKEEKKRQGGREREESRER